MLDVYVDDEHAESILTDSAERLNEEISDRSDRIVPLLTENEIREFGGLLDPKGPTLEVKLETLKIEGTTSNERRNSVLMMKHYRHKLAKLCWHTRVKYLKMAGTKRVLSIDILKEVVVKL